MNYEKAKQNATTFLSLTSLKVEEFEKLFEEFYSIWVRYHRWHTLEGKKRSFPKSKPEKDTKTLPSAEDKLLFILVYLKNYPLQQFQASAFGLSQAKVSIWVKILQPLLLESLKKLGVVPLREGYKLAELLEQFGESSYSQDVTERPIQRSLDDSVQKSQFSGKKKAHTIKNNLVGADSQQILYLSQTYDGTVFDKRIADIENCTFPLNTRLRQDKGFQGYAPEGVHIVQPIKKPRNGELSEMAKWFNKLAGKERISIEHANSGIKRCRIVKELCRSFSLKFRDQIMLLCTALHNFRVQSPFRKYKSRHTWARE